MFSNFFKTALRTFSRNRNYTIINIAGLAVGIAVCITIFVIIQFHKSFDEYHSKKQRIGRMLTAAAPNAASSIVFSKDVPFPLPATLQTAFPQVEKVAPLFASNNDQLMVLDESGKTIKAFKESKGVVISSPALFEIFDLPLLAGTYQSLKDPNTVLLTRETAEKYFGDWRLAMGKTLKLELGGYIFEHGFDILKVTGVLESIPANSDLQVKMVIAYGTGASGSIMARSTEWNDKTNSGFGCYVLLPSNLSFPVFNQQLVDYTRRLSLADNKETYSAQPLGEVHFDTQTGNLGGISIGKELLNVLWLLAAFILLIACVNFINLSTAQAVNRAKEVGVRKVLGSNRAQLRIQFIVETFLIVLSSVLLATGLAALAIPYVNQLLDLSISVKILVSPSILLFLLSITVLVTLLAGLYPSMILSAFNPIAALKTKFNIHTNKGISFRKVLVVFQFVIAQALIIGTFVVVEQMNFFMQKPLGFDKEAIINVPFRVDSVRISRLDLLRDKLLAVKGIKEVSYSSNTPVEAANDMWTAFRFDGSLKDADFTSIIKFADAEYVNTYQLTLVAGRNLQASPMTREFLVNESFVKGLGIQDPASILNKEVSIWNGLIKCPIVGVVKDFNNRSFRQALSPLLLSTNVTMYSQAGIKLETIDMNATLQAVKSIWEQNFPDFVYEYRFLDEKIAAFYKQENQLASLYKIFALLAIFLSCLGLYGLASFLAVQKIKEVGIRKVLGASVSNIVYLFSKEFIVLIAIAFVIAAPLAWYFMNQWLADYVYRINIAWWIFIVTVLSAVFIAVATVSFQAIKAALTKPIQSLRSE